MVGDDLFLLVALPRKFLCCYGDEILNIQPCLIHFYYYQVHTYEYIQPYLLTYLPSYSQYSFQDCVRDRQAPYTNLLAFFFSTSHHELYPLLILTETERQTEKAGSQTRQPTSNFRHHHYYYYCYHYHTNHPLQEILQLPLYLTSASKH